MKFNDYARIQFAIADAPVADDIWQSIYRLCRLQNGFVLSNYDHVRLPNGICQLKSDISVRIMASAGWKIAACG